MSRREPGVENDSNRGSDWQQMEGAVGGRAEEMERFVGETKGRVQGIFNETFTFDPYTVSLSAIDVFMFLLLRASSRITKNPNILRR